MWIMQIIKIQTPNVTGSKQQGSNFHKMDACWMMVYLEMFHNEHSS